MSPCSGDPGSYPEDGSSLAPPLLEVTSLHTAIDLKKRTEAASNKLDQVRSLHPWMAFTMTLLSMDEVLNPYG